ncbi:hypothetical protein ACHAW6_003268 [Cyclotella cf. meneghiniana]
MASHTPAQLSQALSLLNTSQCVDIKSIMMELGISRPLARSIMEEMASQCCPGKGYKAIRLGGSGDNRSNRHKFSLGEKGTIFSIVTTSPSNDADDHRALDENDELQSVIAAHEKSIADQRDLASTEEGLTELLHIFDISSCQGRGVIRPPPEVMDNSSIRRVARARMGASVASLANGNRHGANIVVKAGGDNAVKRGKETTAAAFFAQKDTKKKPTVEKSGGNGANVGKEKHEEQPPPPPAAAAKDAQTNISAKSANVDDFQGDTDEDDDFLRQDQERKARVARETRKEIRANVVDSNVKKRNTGSLKERRTGNPEKKRGGGEKVGNMDKTEDKEDEDMDIEHNDANASAQKGGMDAFAKKNVAAMNADGTIEGSKKRRKKLVEKTIMENGYLKTETVTVWEDVDDEEAEARPSTSSKALKGPAPAKSKSAPTKGKKQGNLMGFFQKK